MFSLTKTRFPTRWGLVVVILAVGIVGAILATQGASADSNSAKLWDAVGSFASGTVTNEASAIVIAGATVTLDFSAGDTAVLSSKSDGSSGVSVDNFITVDGDNICPSSLCFTGSPIDISSEIPLGKTKVLIEWRDFGGSASTSDVYLVTSAKILRVKQVLLICHAPPDNPDNGQEIKVSKKAAEKHLANHPDDTIGNCV